MRAVDARPCSLLAFAALAVGLGAQSHFRELVRGVLPFAASPADCLALADIDGDGDLDLVLGQANGSLQLWLQSTRNTYVDGRTRLPPASPGAVRALVSADVDRDGDPDLIVVTSAGERILINQAGRFRDESATRLPGLLDDSRDGFVFDADRDGDDDLFIANVGQNRLYLNDGTGVFTDGTAARLPVDNESAGTASPIDVDGDGDPDIFVGNNGIDRLLLNDGRGTFTALANWSGAPLHATHDSLVVDIDRDGDSDIVVANSLGVGVYRNDRGPWPGFGVGGVVAQTLAAADLNRDGWPDLLAGQLTSTEVLFSQRQRDPRFTITDGAFPGVIRDARASAFADLDGDGDPDLVVATSSGTAVFFNDGNGGFLDPPSTPLITPSLPAVAATGDVDGDGDMDIVFVPGPDANYAIVPTLHENDGRGNFVRHRLPWFSEPLNAAVLVDVTGDGLADLICATDGAEQLLINQGRGTFVNRSQNLQQRNDRTVAVAAGDIDGDGDVDLVFAGDNHLVVERNAGNGTFTASSIATGRTYVTGAILADLDGDGDLDLATSSLGSPNRLFVNDGRGSFSALASFAPPAENSRAVAAGDLDGDGDLDLVFANWGQNRIYRNDPAGFVDVTATSLPPAQDACDALALGDVDGDGDLDLILGVLGRDRLLLNDGRGVFTLVTSRMATVDEATRSLLLFDADGDGDLDLLNLALFARPRLLTNLTRQLQARSYAMVGASYDGDFFAEPWRVTSQTVVPMLALSTTAAPLRTPFGALWLDPATAITLRARTTSATTGMAPLNLPVPDLLTLRGLPLAVQAIVLHGAAAPTWRLTNALIDRVAR